MRRYTARLMAGSAMLLILAGCSGMMLPTPRGHAQHREPLAVPPIDVGYSAERRIAELQDRVEHLERRLSSVLELASTVAGAAPYAPGSPAGTRVPAPAAAPAAEVAQAPAAPDGGTDAVGDEELSRALSRTLIEQGGLVLPPFAAEITPELAYSHRGSSGLQLFNVNGATSVGFVDTREDTITTAITGRLGLPYSSQIEVQVPFAYERVRTNRLGVDETSSDRGIGDVQVTLSKQLLRERGIVPDLLGSVTWRAPTGSASLGADEPSVGTGYHALRAGLTAVKSQDPLVYYGSLSYTKNFSDTVSGLDIDPGDTIGARIGTILAVSPQTSLRTVLDSEFRRTTEINGTQSPGSDDVAASVELGVATVLTERMLLDVTAGFGVTDAAPDFRFSIALPYRF